METSISFFGVSGYNKLIKFNEENFVFADFRFIPHIIQKVQ